MGAPGDLRHTTDIMRARAHADEDSVRTPRESAALRTLQIRCIELE